MITRLLLEAQGAKDAEKQIADLRKEQDRLSGVIKDSARTSGTASKEFNDLVDQYKEAIQAEKDLRSVVEQTNDKYGERRKALQANAQFDRTSQGVSLAGDVESNLRTIGGAAGAFGATGIERGTAQLAELPAVIEALPRLKESLVGLPSAIGEAVTALGPVGVAMGAVALAAGVLFNELNKAEQKIVESNKNARDSFADLTREIADGSLTTEEINKRIADVNQQREAEEKILAAQEAEYQNYIESAGALAAGVKAVSSVEEDRVQAIEDTKKRIADLQQDEEGLTAARESGGVAANDAAEAERQLAQERTNQLLSDAQLAGDLEDLRLRAQDQTREQIQAELDNLERRRQAIEAELKVLQESGDTSEAVQAQIEKLNSELEALSKKSDVLTGAQATAKSENEVKQARQDSTKAAQESSNAEKEKAQAERESAKAAQDAQRAYEQAQRAQNQYSQAVDTANTNYKNAIEDIGRGLTDDLIDNQREAQDSLKDVERDYAREQVQAAIQQKRDLAKVDKDAAKAESDALRQRNFAQYADSQQQRKDAREAAQLEYQQEGQDRLQEAQYQRQDIVEEARRQTRDLQIQSQRQARDADIARDRAIQAARQRLNYEQQALQQSLQLAQQFAQNFPRLIQQGLQAVNGAGGRSVTGGGSFDLTQRDNLFGANVP